MHRMSCTSWHCVPRHEPQNFATRPFIKGIQYCSWGTFPMCSVCAVLCVMGATPQLPAWPHYISIGTVFYNFCAEAGHHSSCLSLKRTSLPICVLMDKQ